MTAQSDPPRQIALFTDFGDSGPYTGQVEAVLAASGLPQPVIRLLSDAPPCNPKASAYLLAALASVQPVPALFVAVVDPGVGGDRLPLLLRTDKHWFVGPDNGLLSQVLNRAAGIDLQSIAWPDNAISASFHGRDLFAPAAAILARGGNIQGASLSPADTVGAGWSQDLWEIVYIDHYGNAFTGIRAAMLHPEAPLTVAGRRLLPARTFSELPAGGAFWYRNSIGLVEIAVNCGRADRQLGLQVGDLVSLEPVKR